MADGGNDNSSVAGSDQIQLSSWPASCFHPENRAVVSVVCCSNTYYWAVHENAEGTEGLESCNKKSLVPTLFWTTTSVDTSEMAEKGVSKLYKYFPAKALVSLCSPKFDSPEYRTGNNILHTMTAKRIPYFEVYVVAHSPDHAAGILKLFAALPCRIVQLQPKDFLPGDAGLDVDQCALLYGATSKHKGPCLVLNAGPIMSYTCTVAGNKLLGGGIMPGLSSKFHFLREESGGALPMIGKEELEQIIDDLEKETKPLITFAKSTREAVLVGVMRETAIHLASVVRSWVAAVTSQDKENHDDDRALRIFLAGRDSWIVEKLLKHRFSGLLDDEDGNLSLGEEQEFDIVINKNLANTAVGILLNEKAVLTDSPSQLEKMRHELLGQRVAIRGQEGGAQERGTIYDIVRGDTLESDQIKVKNDDGSSEMLSLPLLYASLVEFVAVGEDSSYEDSDGEERRTIRQNAEQLSSALAEQFPSLLENKPAASPAKRATRSEVSEVSPPPKKKSRTSGTGSTRGRKPASAASSTPVKKPFVSITKKNVQTDPKGYISRRVAKMFGDELYFGTVKMYEADLWHIEYDDGDHEDYDAKEMVMHLKEYELRESEDKVGKKRGRG